MLRLARSGIRQLDIRLRAFTALMPDSHGIAQTRRDLRHRLVQDARALRAANHQHAHRAFTARETRLRQRQRQHVGAHRVAHHFRLRERAGERLHHAARDFRKPFVGQPRDAVLLMQDDRNTERPRRQPARAGYIAAHAQHHIGLKTFHARPRLPPGVKNTHRGQQQRFHAFSTQAGDPDKIDLNAVFRHQVCFHAIGGPQPANLPSLRHQMVRYGKSWKDVSARSARHHHQPLWLTTHREPRVNACAFSRRVS